MTVEEIVGVIHGEMAKQGVSHGEMARRSGLTRQTVRHWKDGKRDTVPRLDALIMAAEALGLEIIIREKAGGK